MEVYIDLSMAVGVGTTWLTFERPRILANPFE
jgi:hypothetical protein